VHCFFFQGGDIAKGNGEFAQLVLPLHFAISFPSQKKAAIPLPTFTASHFLCSLIYQCSCVRQLMGLHAHSTPCKLCSYGLLMIIVMIFVFISICYHNAPPFWFDDYVCHGPSVHGDSYLLRRGYTPLPQAWF
jgi:hypothetical protein